MEWESDITRKKFEDALVIFMLCSENLIKSFLIMKNESKNFL